MAFAVIRFPLVYSLLVFVLSLLPACDADLEAIEPGFKPFMGSRSNPVQIKGPAADGSQKTDEPPVGFQLPSFGVNVSYKPDIGKEKGHEGEKGDGKADPASKPATQRKTKEQLQKEAQEAKRKQDEEAKKRREDEAKKKAEELKRQSDSKRKREEEDANKRREIDMKQKKKDDEDAKRRRETEKDKRENERKGAAKGDGNKTDQPSNKITRKRSPIPKKFQAPSSGNSNGGIAGVGGGSLPDPGFVLEHGDLFQKADNGASPVIPTFLAILVPIALTFVFM